MSAIIAINSLLVGLPLSLFIVNPNMLFSTSRSPLSHATSIACLIARSTLEEVVVPILILSKKPENIELCFVKRIIELKGREPAMITIYSNIPLTSPTMIVEMGGRELAYEGEPMADQQHFRFTMPEIKRAKTYNVNLYDGGRLLQSGLTFTVKKGTKEVDFFEK